MCMDVKKSIQHKHIRFEGREKKNGKSYQVSINGGGFVTLVRSLYENVGITCRNNF